MSSGHLYAVLFSNGTVKVGRGKSADARIASHRDRLSVAGIDVVSTMSIQCEDIEAREAVLIKGVSALGGVCRGNEWFSGVEFDDVCRLLSTVSVSECAEVLERKKASPLYLHLVQLPLSDRRLLAERCNTTAGHLNNVAYGDRTGSPALAAQLEKATGGKVMRWDVRQDDWHLIWEDLRTRPDAPPIPTSSAAPAGTEVQTAHQPKEIA